MTANQAAQRPAQAPAGDADGGGEPEQEPGEVARDRVPGVTRLVRRLAALLAPAWTWLVRRPDAAVIGGYVLLALWTNARQVIRPYTRVNGHLVTDNTLFYWYLEHGAYTLRHLTNPFFTTQMNAPDGVNMMANTTLLGITLPLAPLTMLFGAQFSYVVLVTIALAGSAATAYYVLSRHVVRSRVGAAIGGAFWGFAPGIVHHANGQPNHAANFLIPLIVLAVFRLAQGPMLRRGVTLGLLVTWQVFINEELLLLTALACAVTVIVWSAMRWSEAKRLARRLVTAGLVAVGVAGVLLAYPVWFQFRGPQSYHGIPHVFSVWGEDVAAYFAYSRDTLAGSPHIETTIGVTEQNSWYGIPLVLLILAVAVVMWRRSQLARITTVVAIVFALLAIGPSLRIRTHVTPIPGPWRIVDYIPLVSFMVPSRMVYVVTACIAVMLALACDHLPSLNVTTAPLRVRTLWYVALAVALVPLVPTPMPVTSTAHVPAFITSGGWRAYVDENHTLTPVPLANNVAGLDALYWQVRADLEYRQPEGYFLGPDLDGRGHFGAPSSASRRFFDAIAEGGRPPLTPEIRDGVLADLRRWRSAIIVVDPVDAQAPRLRAAVTEITGVQPSELDGAWVWDVRSLVDGGGR